MAYKKRFRGGSPSPFFESGKEMLTNIIRLQWGYWRVLDLVDYFLHSFQLLHLPKDFTDLPVTVFIIASQWMKLLGA